jgi:dTDP-4-dehydrorhamnose reductase
MAVILVTGSNGQLGNELKIVSKKFYGYDFIFTDLQELDLTIPEQISEFIKKSKPDWIINCAAYNLVDRAESEPDAALLVNGTSVKNITEAIKGSECRLIHISTDYVFSGTSNIPYTELSVPDPSSAYGKSKLAGEKFALTHNASMVIRTSWLYSSFGNNFVKTILRNARERDSLKVVFDQTGTPTYAADCAEAIMNIVSGVIRNQFAFNAGIYNFSNEGVCSWYDFAVEIVHDAGLSCIVYPVHSDEYKVAAKRPAFSVMDKTKIKDNYNLTIPHWRDALIRCMKLLK